MNRPWRIPNAAWAWEGLRRNSSYRRDYRAAIAGRPKFINLESGAGLLRARRRFIAAEKWGLLIFANPDFSASNADVFWMPDVLAGALRVKLSPIGLKSDYDASPHDTILLSALKTRRMILESVDGIRHYVLSGDRFWIQLYSVTQTHIGDHAEVDIRLDGAKHLQRRLDTAAQLLSLHRSTGGQLSLIGRRRNSTYLAKQLEAFDIWHGFERPRGDLKAVAKVIVGNDRVALDWGIDDRALRVQAQRYIQRGEAFVEGKYRALLTKKTL